MVETNPPTNQLPDHIALGDVETAILKSGYPLQTFVASQLPPDINYLVEEWAFIDSDTGQQRTIDIYCSKYLYDIDGQQADIRVRPQMNLLIECKKSDQPYIFFRSKGGSFADSYPIVTGLRSEKMSFKLKGDSSTYMLRILEALGMENHPLLKTAPVHSRTFSKLVANGKKLSLSGDEPFTSAVLPMTKAMLYLQNAAAPPPTAEYFDLHAIFGVVVLDAPMIVVDASRESAELEFAPWVRLYRNSAALGSHYRNRSRTFAIDFVHRDYFRTFVSEKLIPFADELSERAIKRQVALAKGSANISGPAEFPWSDIDSYY